MTITDINKPTSPSTPLGDILFGRYMLNDMSEYPCQVADLNVNGASFKAGSMPELNSTLVAYIDEIGRIEGTVTEEIPSGFKVQFLLNDSRRDRLQAKLNWLEDKKNGNAPDQRRHIRHQPKDTSSQVVLRDGRSYSCEVIDISLSGAAVKLNVLPAMGTELYLGKMLGKVVRQLESGIAVEFFRELDRKTLADHIAN